MAKIISRSFIESMIEDSRQVAELKKLGVPDNYIDCVKGDSLSRKAVLRRMYDIVCSGGNINPVLDPGAIFIKTIIEYESPGFLEWVKNNA